MQVEPKFIVSLQGKDFILYDGLLDMAHQMGLVELTPELVKLEKDCVVFKATAVAVDGDVIRRFTGHGDATPENVNRMIRPHMIRMAETRAKARALRDLTNVGMCSVEELGGDDARPATIEDALDVFDKPAEVGSFISDAQQKRLFALAGYEKGNEEAMDRAKEIVKELLDKADLKSTKEIKKGKEYNEICQEAEVLLADRAITV